MGPGARIDHLQERLDALRSLTLRSDLPISPADVDELTTALRRLHEVEAELEANRAELDAARQAVELEQQRCREQLADADRARVQFLTTMSHELRTPLNVVLGWTFRLRANKLEADQSARAVASIDRNARRELRLVEDLLDSARIACGQLPLHVETYELAPLLQPAVDALAETASTKSIALTCDFSRHVYVRADPERIHQIAWNLLSNAVKFTPKAGTVRVTLSAERPDAVFAVADTGIGIQPTCAVASVRVVLAGGAVHAARPHRPGARPGDREAPRRAARRSGRGREPGAKARLHVHGAPAAGRGLTSGSVSHPGGERSSAARPSSPLPPA